MYRKSGHVTQPVTHPCQVISWPGTGPTPYKINDYLNIINNLYINSHEI